MLKFAVQKQALAEGIPPRTPFTPVDADGAPLPFKTPNNDPELSPTKQGAQSPLISQSPGGIANKVGANLSQAV